MGLLGLVGVDMAGRNFLLEGCGWSPLGGGSWGSLLHHLVNLLKSKTLGLGNEQVGVDEGGSAESSPDEEDTGSEVALVGVNPGRRRRSQQRY